MTLTPEQQRALDHARDVLAEEQRGDTAAAYGSPLEREWRARMLRLALRDILAAFQEELP
jgi:hypothetical protein